MYKQALNSLNESKNQWFWWWIILSIILKLLPFWPDIYHAHIYPWVFKFYVSPLSHIAFPTLIYFYIGLIFLLLSFIYFRGIRSGLKFILFTLSLFWWLWGYNYGVQHESFKKIELKSHSVAYWEKELNFWMEGAENLLLQGALNKEAAIIPGRYEKASPQGILSFWGTSGFYFPFSGQAYYAHGLHPIDINFTILHELQHQHGIASEALCNYLAVKESLGSSSKHDQLGAHIHIIKHLIQYISQEEIQFDPTYPPLLEKFMTHRREWYKGWSGKGAKFQSQVYHLFLQSNGESSGMLSYYDDLAYLYGNELFFK